MRKIALLPILATALYACNPLILSVPKSETIEVTVGSGDYVTRDIAGEVDQDCIRVQNDEIASDREIEVYYQPNSGDYWGLVVDVNIFINKNGGELLILDPLREYEGSLIRVIVSWYVEEKHHFEKVE